ncbi:hypothetical protein [Carboxylicivirga sp. N1Y90]|uniref:hypothetical protein n=1 Tax=Carboxylicivirga fragile TaxID=3417571 RepID=UPI003D340640|nr:hypothetical protein [Marinilabiliaceae bacterium N1Y90]
MYNEESKRELEEEYPKGEEMPKEDQSKIIESCGLGKGFGIKYSTFYYFLYLNDAKGLEDYLKKRGMPFAEKFKDRLVGYYNHIIASNDLPHP